MSVDTLRAVTAELDVPGKYIPLYFFNGQLSETVYVDGVSLPVPVKEARTIDIPVGRTVRRYYDGGHGMRLLGSVPA